MLFRILLLRLAARLYAAPPTGWLVQSVPSRAKVTPATGGRSVALTNGLLLRRWTLQPDCATIAFDNLTTPPPHPRREARSAARPRWRRDARRRPDRPARLRLGELLRPLAGAIGRELLAGGYIQADETPVDVQMHDRRGQNHQAYLWQYGRPGGGAVFDFRLGRGREGPQIFLGKFEGILQTGGYAAHERVGGPKMVHACRWAHARRGFHEAHKLSPMAERILPPPRRFCDLPN